MTRLEQLTANLADDLLTENERGELEGLLAESPAARVTYFRLLELEAALRASRQGPDLVSSTMARLHREAADAIARNVMSELRALPMADWRRTQPPQATAARPRGKFLRVNRQLPGRRRLAPAWIALAVCLVLLAAVGFWYFGPTMGEPVLAEIQGTGLSLERAGQSIAALTGTRLQPGDVLRTPPNVTATIGFSPERTRLTVRPGSELGLMAWSRGKRFTLASGKLEVSAARQQPFRPMAIRTPQAEARVLGTRFALAVTTNATRLDVAEGTVQFIRLSDAAAVKVPADHSSIVANATDLAALPKTGYILRQWWGGISGKTVNDLRHSPRFPGHADGADLATALELQPVATNHLGFRFCGYVHPPVTGKYEFWLAGATDAVLFMSRDENPGHKGPIASAVSTSRKLDQPRFQGGSSWAPPVPLVAGRRYYIEALVLIENGEGHLSVAWKRPGASRELLTGEYLSPFKPK